MLFPCFRVPAHAAAGAPANSSAKESPDGLTSDEHGAVGTVRPQLHARFLVASAPQGD